MFPAITKLFQNHVRFTSVILSLLLSLWVIYTDDVINIDGILYLRVAAFLQQGNWAAALAYYDWPFYSALIALASNITGLGLEPATDLLNAILFALTTYAFLSVIKELGGDRKVQIAAALVILLYPELNENRADIFRDNGYWSFYLLSLWFFIRYYRVPDIYSALSWGVSIALATLFRIEGLAIWLLLPVLFLVRRELNWGQRLSALGGAYAVGLFGVLLLLLWRLISPDTFPDQGGRLSESSAWLSYLSQNFGAHLQMQADRLNTAILNSYSAHYAMDIVIVIVFALLAFVLLGSLGPIFALLLAHSFFTGRYRFYIPLEIRPVLGWLITINVLALSLFTAKYFFLTGRYVLPLALTLLLSLPFHLVSCWENWRTISKAAWARQIWLAITVLAIIALAVDSLYSFGPSKIHLRNAGQWVGQRVTSGAKLFSNEPELTYYALTQPAMKVITGNSSMLLAIFRSGAWRNFDYLVVREKNPDRQKFLVTSAPSGLELAITFENNRRDKVLVFRKKVQTKTLLPIPLPADQQTGLRQAR